MLPATRPSPSGKDGDRPVPIDHGRHSEAGQRSEACATKSASEEHPVTARPLSAPPSDSNTRQPDHGDESNFKHDLACQASYRLSSEHGVLGPVHLTACHFASATLALAMFDTGSLRMVAVVGVYNAGFCCGRFNKRHAPEVRILRRLCHPSRHRIIRGCLEEEIGMSACQRHVQILGDDPFVALPSTRAPKRRCRCSSLYSILPQ